MTLAKLSNDQVHYVACLLAAAEGTSRLREIVHVRDHGRRYRLELDSRRVQVFSCRSVGWQLRASRPLADDTFAVVLVDLSQNPPNFYPVPGEWLKADVASRYSAYLEQHGGRPRSPDSDHYGLKTYMVERWRDRWDVLTGETS
jgi:hypothetical protein